MPMKVRRSPTCVPKDVRDGALRGIYTVLEDVQEDIFRREDGIKQMKRDLQKGRREQRRAPMDKKIADSVINYAEKTIQDKEESLRLLRIKLERGKELEALIKAIPDC